MLVKMNCANAGGGLNPVNINIYPLGTTAYGIGNMDVRDFKDMTIQRKNSGMGIGIYQVSSMSDTSKTTALGISWGDTNVHNIDLTNIDYIYIWGDGATGAGSNEMILNY